MNEAQKNFNKQMTQSLKELKNKDKDAYHDYVKWNHLDDAKSRIKEENHQKVVGILSAPFKILAKLIGIIIIIGIGYNFVKGINNNGQSLEVNILKPVTYSQSQTRTSNQKEIISYLNIINPIINSISQDINLRNKDLDEINKKLLTENEYINDSTVYINRINSNITKITKTSCPKVLESYKSILLIQYSSLIKAMNIEIQYLSSGKATLKNECTKNIEESNSKNDEAQKDLNSILEANKLK